MEELVSHTASKPWIDPSDRRNDHDRSFNRGITKLRAAAGRHLRSAEHREQKLGTPHAHHAAIHCNRQRLRERTVRPHQLDQQLELTELQQISFACRQAADCLIAAALMTD